MNDFIFKSINTYTGLLNLKATFYRSKIRSKGVILYFHGGGLIMGHRKDLPNFHIERITSQGYSILSFDYRLVPESNFENILIDVIDAIEYYIDHKEDFGSRELPYFLWGRSAGAYLCLLASTRDLSERPIGLISYYGYGFTVPHWYNSPSHYYLKYPRLKKSTMEALIGHRELVEGSLQSRYPIYLYSRQSGSWLSLLSSGKEKDFLDSYSLLNLPEDVDFPSSLLVHSFNDQDVPFRESVELSNIIEDSSLLTFSLDKHDFDRDVSSGETKSLINKTIEFLNKKINDVSK